MLYNLYQTSSKHHKINEVEKKMDSQADKPNLFWLFFSLGRIIENRSSVKSQKRGRLGVSPQNKDQ